MPRNADTLHVGIGKLAAADPEVDIYPLNDDGSIVASSVPAAAWRRSWRTTSAMPRARMCFRRHRLTSPTVRPTLFYVVLRRAKNQPGATRLRTNNAVGESAAVIVTSAVLAVARSFLFLRLLTRRLGGDEVDRLEALFGDLAARIEARMEALRLTDVMRRDLLANVSHDLRTPLTTLLAHLETLRMKESELVLDERGEYLDIAMCQTRRIGLLVEQLLEAARPEAGQVAVNVETFAIGELLQGVVQKFALAARDRDVALNRTSWPRRHW